MGAEIGATTSIFEYGDAMDRYLRATGREEVAAAIIRNANPRAYAVVIGPGRPIQHLDAPTQEAILVAAESDFIEGIRFSLATAMVFLALVLAAGFAWFPRGKGSIADAERGAMALE